MTDGSCRSGWKVGLVTAAFSACVVLANFGATGGCWAKSCQASNAIASPSIAAIAAIEASESPLDLDRLRQPEPVRQWLCELTKRSLRGAWFTLEDQLRRQFSLRMWRDALSRFTIPVDRIPVPIVGYTLD
ncbi:hypothetical protein [Tuwongella immobilis]|uniref:Uncharacterized protein n=1 Tax=Tuwongella immobilis TaxID=692036 RepID=A0A6C2YVV8_9BACT|nr:hypothetical protein [Tuwongella immobilis]VIP05760.1 unnamed protein product [Tuwongella immobilis]VTS08876.1 unnamed protein product [Tuwongella immobilis]